MPTGDGGGSRSYQLASLYDDTFKATFVSIPIAGSMMGTAWCPGGPDDTRFEPGNDDMRPKWNRADRIEDGWYPIGQVGTDKAEHKDWVRPLWELVPVWDGGVTNKTILKSNCKFHEKQAYFDMVSVLIFFVFLMVLGKVRPTKASSRVISGRLQSQTHKGWIHA